MAITTSDVALDVVPLSGRIGAEIRGLDLHHPFDADTLAAVRATWLRHRVVFFPDANLTPAEHVAFARQFGDLTPAHPVIPGITGFPEVFEIDYQKTAKLAATYGKVSERTEGGRGIDWHTDVTFVERPPTGSILNAIVIPPYGGDTMWSNQVAAYEALSAPLRGWLDGLTAVHDGSAAFGPALKQRKEGVWEGEVYTALDPVEHPVIRTHPETGERSLFVNPGFTSHIKGLRRDESAHLLQYLYAHSTKPEFVVRYHWHAGTIGFWDNRATQHSVIADYGDQDRIIHRVTLHGDKPV